jgi:hypothetical protein
MMLQAGDEKFMVNNVEAVLISSPNTDAVPHFVNSHTK